MTALRTTLRALLPALLLWASAAAAEAPRRFSLCIGNAEGGPGTRPLRYAERDARRIHDILTRLGGVEPEDAKLLLSSSAADVRRALAELGQKAQAAKAAGQGTLLVVYYSGHAKDGELRLGSSRMPVSELRAALQESPADVRIGFVDSCQSGAITRAKGLREAPAVDVDKLHAAASNGPKGLVLIASSAADEESQESDEINASFFTHYLATGLLGDADVSGDGKVTLAEAYAYAYGRTLGATAATRAGAQHPVYQFDLGGAGDVVLTELQRRTGGLVFGQAAEGLFVVLDGTRRAVAEVAKAPGAERRLALAPGRYLVKKRLDDELLVGEFAVADELVPFDEARLQKRPLSKDPQKGASGPRWSFSPTLGYQRFFDEGARQGLFPPAGLLGVEAADRDDLGRGLAWGLDVAAGGGAATLALEDQPPAKFSFTELNGGAALWKEFPLGPLTLSAGARIGFVYLHRSFDGRSDLPAQYFFTLTPGLTAGLSWRFTERFSAVAKARLNYLFYNVDKNQSLGFADFSLGIQYELGD
jgi:hypothetical protein